MSSPQYVRLFLVPQTDSNMTMPASVTGLLTGETANSYILNPMLDVMEDEETYENRLAEVGMNFISKTYVWRCQILSEKPREEAAMQTSEGLGE